MNLIVRQPNFLKKFKAIIRVHNKLKKMLNEAISSCVWEKPITGLMYDYLFLFCTDVFYAGFDL